ncbi:hypothetical protein E5720_09425 [Rhodococcus sp. PAMC28707]|uniref:hypothetical protein n=1 Tax=unclassified Rhodococcus (in: high G+C Gram-positive bacteria) TaxID=192944 RepID=UPI00109DC4F3|nr:MULTISPECIES: hypothetical protein [unclassified Rhodococcus (in: high G+C Gram-positive bacteria)]QCB49607.1 hypothetical protein E5769_04590 [Rhodococcus sp. PAMC28705]QCB58703.1 hypothetical protein E5720_09425 [Rhodococcus sp. PAMC28707]
MIDDPSYARVMESIARLEEARRHVDSVTIGASTARHTVTAKFLARLAESPHASPELREFARRVSVKDTTWDRIELDAKPIPAEVHELRADPLVDWPGNWPLQIEEQPFRIEWQ